MTQDRNHLVIMAGGVGSRFWPMSTEDNPKQFIDILGVARVLRKNFQHRYVKFTQHKKPSLSFFRRHHTNEVVGRRVDFSSDANANFEGLLEVNRGICMPQMAEKTSPDVPPNCAVVPLLKDDHVQRDADRGDQPAQHGVGRALQRRSQRRAHLRQRLRRILAAAALPDLRRPLPRGVPHIARQRGQEHEQRRIRQLFEDGLRKERENGHADARGKQRRARGRTSRVHADGLDGHRPVVLHILPVKMKHRHAFILRQIHGAALFPLHAHNLHALFNGDLKGLGPVLRDTRFFVFHCAFLPPLKGFFHYIADGAGKQSRTAKFTEPEALCNVQRTFFSDFSRFWPSIEKLHNYLYIFY